jgi:hypothetical protein
MIHDEEAVKRAALTVEKPINRNVFNGLAR